MKKQANLSCVMIVQQLDAQYWHDWNKKFIDEANHGNIRPLLEEIVNKLERSNCVVTEAYGIIHDKDEISVWDSEKMANVIEKKTKHLHLLIKFSKGNTLNNLAMATGIEPQYLEKAKSGRYGYDNMTAYLVHAKDPQKYQYDPKSVATLRGEEYFSVYNRQMKTWVQGRAIKEATETNQSVDYVVSEIVAGNLSKSQIMLTDELYKIYASHKRRINEAFETFGESKSYQTIANLEAGAFKKTVIFIQGKSGSGKTIAGNKIITTMQKIALKQSSNRWDYCLTASTNAFDEYNGQDILFLDDIRGDSLTASDWLKLLDPYMISPISARYHNKMGSAKVIIITSTKSPIDFFKQAKGNFNEDLGQFFRRIDILVDISDIRNYSLATTIENELYSSSDSLTHSYKFSEFPYRVKGNGKIDKLIANQKNDNSSCSHRLLDLLHQRKRNKVIAAIIKQFIFNMKWIEKNIHHDRPKNIYYK